MKKRSIPQYPHNQPSNNWTLPCSHKFKIFNLKENCMQNSAICVQQCTKKVNPQHLKNPHRPQTQQQLFKTIFYKIEQSQKISKLTSSLFRDYENSETYFKQIGNIMEVKIKQVCNQALKSENNEVVGRLLGTLFQGRISELKCHEVNMIFNCERQFSSFTSRKLVDLEVVVKSEIIKLLNHIIEAGQRIEGHFQNFIEMFSKIRKPQQIQLQTQQHTQVTQAPKTTLGSPVQKKAEKIDKDKRISQIEKNPLKSTQPVKPQQKVIEIQKSSTEINKNIKQTPKEVQKKPQPKNIVQKPVDNAQKTINAATAVEKMIPEESEKKVELKKTLEKSNLPTLKQKIQQTKQQQKPKQQPPQIQKEPNKQVKQVKQQQIPNLRKAEVLQNETQKKQENDSLWNMLVAYKRTNSVAGIFDGQAGIQNTQVKDELKKKVKVTTQDDQKPKVSNPQLIKETIKQKQGNIQNIQSQQHIRKQVKMLQPSINSLMNQKRAQLQGETYNPYGRKIISKDSNTPAANLEKRDPAKATPPEKMERPSSTIDRKPEYIPNVVNKKGFMEGFMKQEQDLESEKEIQVPKKTQQYPSKLITKESDSLPKSKDPIPSTGKEVLMKEQPKQVGLNKPVLSTNSVGETMRRNDETNIKKNQKVIIGETRNEPSKSYSLLGHSKPGQFLAGGNKPSQHSFLSKPAQFEDKAGKEAQKVDRVQQKSQQASQKLSTTLKNPSQKSPQSRQQAPKPLSIRKPLGIGKVVQNTRKPLPQLTEALFQKAARLKQQQIQKQSQFNQISLHGELQQPTNKDPTTDLKQLKQEIRSETPSQPQPQNETLNPLVEEKQKQQQQPTQRRINFNNTNYLQNRNAFKDWQK